MRFPATPNHTDSLVTGVPGTVRTVAAPHGDRPQRPRYGRAGEHTA